MKSFCSDWLYASFWQFVARLRGNRNAIKPTHTCTHTHTLSIKRRFYSLQYHFSFPAVRYSLKLLKGLKTQNISLFLKVQLILRRKYLILYLLNENASSEIIYIQNQLVNVAPVFLCRIKTHLWNQEFPIITSNQTSSRAKAHESLLVSDIFKKHFLSFFRSFLKKKLCIFLKASPLCTHAVFNLSLSPGQRLKQSVINDLKNI